MIPGEPELQNDITNFKHNIYVIRLKNDIVMRELAISNNSEYLTRFGEHQLNPNRYGVTYQGYFNGNKVGIPLYVGLF